MTGLGVSGVEPSGFASRESVNQFPYYHFAFVLQTQYSPFLDVKEIVAEIKLKIEACLNAYRE
jgi:hypothetical protein